MVTGSEDDDPLDSTGTVLETVLAYQAAYQRWLPESDPHARETYKRECHALAEQLFLLLHKDLARIAARWLQSGIAPDHQSLTLNMFTIVFCALPHLTVDPQKNVRGLLLTIARRGMYDQYRQLSHDPGSRLVSSPISSGQDYVDPQSPDAEETWIHTIDNRTLLAEIACFWAATLSRIDREIVILRLRAWSFQEIARKFEGQWGEVALRQRYHRAIRRTRIYLRSIGMLAP
jgi:DNA-directed RNA polymerase specialized sigma24 family protein